MARMTHPIDHVGLWAPALSQDADYSMGGFMPSLQIATRGCTRMFLAKLMMTYRAGSTGPAFPIKMLHTRATI